jgi:hydrogenase expression/formation protein HypC
MCLAIPSRIIEIDNGTAVVDVEGIRRETSLLLLENPRVGDYVIVHAGFAIHTIDEEEARETLRILRESLEKE